MYKVYKEVKDGVELYMSVLIIHFFIQPIFYV